MEKWANFAARIGTYNPNQLVFVDESSVDRCTTYHGRAWAIRGQKATQKTFFCQGPRWVAITICVLCLNQWLSFKRFSVLPALSLERGIIHCDVVEGSFDNELFYKFIRHVLDQMEPFPVPNSVLLWTTAAFTNIRQFWTSLNLGNFSYSQQYHPTDFQFDTRGMRYEFLPPYSPDYNPIELAFSAMKYHLPRDGAYIHFAMTQLPDTAIFCTLHKALYQITSEDAFGWFRHCGYIWTC